MYIVQYSRVFFACFFSSFSFLLTGNCSFLFVRVYLFLFSFSLTMDADVVSALKTQAAYLAGNHHRPIIVVKSPAGESLKSTWKKQPLELCLQYLINCLR